MSLQKQTKDPLFEDTLWSQPVNQQAAKKLLIIGGHGQQFSLTQASYQAAMEAGIGEARVVLPKSLRSIIGQAPGCHFVPSTPSGSFGKEGTEEIMRMITECDGALLAGELSTNSETIALIEHMTDQSPQPLMLGDEAVRLLLHAPRTLQRAGRALIMTLTTASELAKTFRIPIYVKQPDVNKTRQLLEALDKQLGRPVVVYDQEQILVSAAGAISVTPIIQLTLAQLQGGMATWWLQHADSFKALTTAAWQLKQAEKSSPHDEPSTSV